MFFFGLLLQDEYWMHTGGQAETRARFGLLELCLSRVKLSPP